MMIRSWRMTNAERIADPARMRALAHPLRLRIIDELTVHDELTATRCAVVTGESVAACSFHLRMLAKYGYVEPAPRRGREKPWRLVGPPLQMQPDAATPGSMAAASAVAAQVVNHEAARLHTYFHRVATGSPPPWMSGSTMLVNVSWMTEAEMAEVANTLNDLAARFEARADDPAQRPPGSRPVRLFAALTAEPTAGDATGDER